MIKPHLIDFIYNCIYFNGDFTSKVFKCTLKIKSKSFSFGYVFNGKTYLFNFQSNCLTKLYKVFVIYALYIILYYILEESNELE